MGKRMASSPLNREQVVADDEDEQEFVQDTRGDED